MVKMLSDKTISRLSARMVETWKEGWHKVTHPKEWAELKQCLGDMIPSYDDPHWNRHYTFGTPSTTDYLPLLGERLRKEILINAFLPILFEKVLNPGDPREIEAFENFYSSFSASRTGKSQYLQQRFFGDSSKGALLKSADIEQGAYHLHHDFCVHYETSCEGCPFIDRYKTTFG